MHGQFIRRPVISPLTNSRPVNIVFPCAIMPRPTIGGHNAMLRSVRLFVCPVFWFFAIGQMATCARRRFKRIR